MALHQLLTPFMMTRVSSDLNPSFVPPTVKVNAYAKISNQTMVRRSGNYKPPVWKHEFIESLKSEFKV